VVLGDEGKALAAFEFLLSKGIYIPAVRYPTVPKGKARLRVTVSAAHTATEIDALIDAFAALGERDGKNP
jgi:8-amino-7-oxononanoate synthase